MNSKSLWISHRLLTRAHLNSRRSGPAAVEVDPATQWSPNDTKTFRLRSWIERVVWEQPKEAASPLCADQTKFFLHSADRGKRACALGAAEYVP